MNGLSSSELLFYSGIGLMGLTAAASVICLIVFKVTGKKIRNILEQEYGKCLR